MKHIEWQARLWLVAATLAAFAVCAVAVQIPIAEQSGRVGASWIRLAFSPACHQITERCLDLGAGPLPICARCGGLYVGSFAGLFLTLVAGRRFQPRLRWLVVAAAPSVVDFVLGLLHLPTLANWPRFTVALLPGLVAGLLLADAICRLGSAKLDRSSARKIT